MDRIVAIKLLPSADPERKPCFEREAQSVAALTYPHVYLPTSQTSGRD
jgi:hypothetical protein